MIKFQKFLAILIVINVIHIANSSTFDDDVTLTEEQQHILQKFKIRMDPKLYQPFMREDIYLVRWLRVLYLARNFDMKAASQFLRTHLKWRQVNDIDEIQNEDWSDLTEEYPHELAGVDKDGLPILVIYFGNWNIRKMALAGKMDRLLRYSDYCMDKGEQRVRQMQTEGKNVTRFTMIVDLTNLNPVQHMSINCIPFYVGQVTSNDNNFPQAYDKMTVVQTPEVFGSIISMVKPIMDDDTRDRLIIHGTNRDKWKSALRNYVDKDQLPVQLGGSKESVHYY